MTEPRRRFDIEPKTGIPTLEQWGAYKRQMALYAEGIFESYRRLYGEPVLVNKLRGRATQTLFSLNDLIHPETVRAMTPKPPTVTSQPLYDDDWRAYGCGCVR